MRVNAIILLNNLIHIVSVEINFVGCKYQYVLVSIFILPSHKLVMHEGPR